jgi:acyl carrier protein
MEKLVQTLKEEIIEALNLVEMAPENIDEEAPLFVDGLGLDSIDALELTVLLEKKYGIKIKTAEEGKKILYSVRSMADCIIANSKA